MVAGYTKRWLLNLALLVFIVVLVLLVKYQPGTSKEKEGPPLTALVPDQITQVRLVRPKQETIVLAKTGQDWMLQAPVRARADSPRVDGLLRLAGLQTEGSFPAIPEELSKYGLDKPAAQVWLNDLEIQFGDAHVFSSRQYVLYNGRIHLIPNSGLRAVTAPTAEFFSTRLLEENRKPVAFKLPKFSLSLQDGTWKVQGKIPAQNGDKDQTLSNDRLNAFAEEWRYARALSVKRYSGKPALDQVRVSFLEEPTKDAARAPAQTATPPAAKTPKTLELAILAYKPELILYRKDEGLEYAFPQEAGGRLLNLTPE